ncbi:hypothetical protein KC968_03855 [Candidatus Saccharibacteria bacterium]|nr:hypothetical protein [Candidatus Saccharibacteria bacterium]
MKLSPASITNKLTASLQTIQKFKFLIIFIVFSAMYGYILMQVAVINDKQPTQAEISAKTKTTPKTKIDEELIEKMNTLEDQNIQVKTIFNEARKNPFAE